MQLTLGDVIAKFPPQVRERYDFTSARYTGALQRISGIRCREHGEFSQYPAQLRKDGAGCPSCGGEVRASKRRSLPEDVIAAARARHNGFYTYERAVYVNNTTKFTVTCPVHGPFDVAPGNHISGGKGCPTCGAIKRGHRSNVAGAARKTADTKLANFAEKFARDAREVHGDVYGYDEVRYAGAKSKIDIRCAKHGLFSQTPEHHLKRAHGCPECSHHRSKGEAALLRFVSIYAETWTRDRATIAPKELDIYAPSASLAIEYCGEYWHAASSVEEERKDRTRHLDKHLACEAQGIRLLTVYESEWLDRPHAIKRLVRNALGKGRGRLMARKCDLRRVGHVEAARFFEAYHPQGGGGFGEQYGLYHRDKLVACMRFTFGGNDRGAHADRAWTLSRYATRVSVAGGASRLFSAFAADNDPETVKSFSDNRYFTGGMYEQLGFALEETSAPDYQVYHPKTGLLPKTAWQRRKIPARIRDLRSPEVFDPSTDGRSERDMTYLLGAQRMFDCGKKRWVWRRP
jgi:hypothetical protein